ncbi:integrase catalytic domain-containing protein [Trichonephila clavata]|uniref:Integrase catalytic domain-containing protein n=1 Tax=Trichonephila clavata TaxID=2740835 RepID=A0A8X6F9F2_TRICU|nr:integrase catalytic domain-containing protein [Trichonephila clavata]
MEVPIITTAEIRVPEKKEEEKKQLGRQGICFIECSVEKCEPEIGILIGADVLWSITSSEIKRINKSCVAIEAAFGWCLSGTFRNEEPLTCGFMNVTSQLTVDLDKSVKSFWELKSIEMNETNDSSSESEKARQIFDFSIILKEKRYEISLPLKEENIKLNENFYVDDFICSVDSDEVARRVYHEAKLILSEASMNLTKWKTNSNALKQEIEIVTSKEVKLGFPDSSSKVLGLKYNSSKDLFTFSPETIVEASHSNEPTKRTVLQISSKLFDPIGTDSLIVLHWIKSSKRWEQFVINRVQEINQKTSPANWYHCPGNQNPADKITRGCSVKQLSQDNS